ncbi:hypothetical protein SAMN03097699_1812 [Flavobacteriaceae bacterium MAR_2010_188]|nr:hypothetical protein SAMN03097699_1812 [Flavobacteriaceae bacterium MAR_2010_188]
MRIIYFIIITLFIFSCENDNVILKIDSEVSEKLDSLFIADNHNSWIEVEDYFYDFIKNGKEVETKKQKLEVLKDFLCGISNNGGIRNGIKLNDKTLSIKTLEALKSSDFLIDNSFNEEFFYDNYRPIVLKFINDEATLDSLPPDVLVGMSTWHPTDVNFQISLVAGEDCERFDYSEFDRSGLYKTTILYYFGNLIKRGNH